MSFDKGAFPSIQSSSWKAWHGGWYLVGGICFLFGSCCYLPSVSDFIDGGWLFTIGSAAFTFTDTFEWLKNNHVGCAFDSPQAQSYQDHCEKLGFPAKSAVEYNDWYWAFKRAEPGLNFFASVVGSTLYLIGSVLFIPPSTIVIGTWVFIFGSAIIFTSQAWKLYRAGCEVHAPTSDTRIPDKLPATSANNYGAAGTATPPGTPPLSADGIATTSASAAAAYKPTFSFSAMLHDLAAFGIDFGACIGGVFYFWGSIFFLPAYANVPNMPFWAAVLFIFGGVSFLVSGICMSHVYFIRKGPTQGLQHCI